MAIQVGQAQAVGCFQSAVNLHNRAILKLSERNVFINLLRIADIGAGADSTLTTAGKITALVVLGIPAALWHALASVYSDVTDCFTAKAVDLNRQNEAQAAA